jgi:hypothetical protein
MQQAGVALKQTDTALREAEAAMTNIRGISDPDSRIFTSSEEAFEKFPLPRVLCVCCQITLNGTRGL